MVLVVDADIVDYAAHLLLRMHHLLVLLAVLGAVARHSQAQLLLTGEVLAERVFESTFRRSIVRPSIGFLRFDIACDCSPLPILGDLSSVLAGLNGVKLYLIFSARLRYSEPYEYSDLLSEAQT